MLRKYIFIRLIIILVKSSNVFCIYSNMHNILGRGRLGASHSLSLKFMHTFLFMREREREREREKYNNEQKKEKKPMNDGSTFCNMKLAFASILQC